ncbi:MAG TPA: hypothetical protein VFP47_04310, partial [Pyrinomonadaceae bacterium]|nr:hypothetical protein [Pyrinomonadaceae bacterium]
MNRTSFLAAAVCIFLLHSVALSQSQDPPKFEVAGEFTTLERGDFSGRRTDPGFGGRFTYNLNKVFSLEAAAYFFPKGCFSCRENGRVTEVLGGVKVGKRFDTWGIFAKARPGVISFSQGDFQLVPAGGGPFPFRFETNNLNGFATDVGAVLEFYPSKRIVTRFDAGDTIIYFPSRTRQFVQFDPSGGFTLVPFTIGNRTTHNF